MILFLLFVLQEFLQGFCGVGFRSFCAELLRSNSVLNPSLGHESQTAIAVHIGNGASSPHRGFTVNRSADGWHQDIVLDAVGPAVVNPNAKFFMGAKRYSSALGELSGVIEPLFLFLSLAQALRERQTS